jgi:ribose/xylose/arabinose/galactoside ABC-type transport system permease subunit
LVTALAVVFTANVLLVILANRVPLCPSRYVAYIFEQRYCTSYPWAVGRLVVVQLLYFALICGVTRTWPRARRLLAQVPLVVLFLGLTEFTQQARDYAAPESADKVEFQSSFDQPVSWGLSFVTVGVLEWALLRRPRHFSA